jgi:hypothetical protein
MSFASASSELRDFIRLLDKEREAAIYADVEALIAARTRIVAAAEDVDPDAPWFPWVARAVEANMALTRHLVMALSSDIEAGGAS